MKDQYSIQNRINSAPLLPVRGKAQLEFVILFYAHIAYYAHFWHDMACQSQESSAFKFHFCDAIVASQRAGVCYALQLKEAYSGVLNAA